VAKDKINEYDSNAANNTVVGDVNLAENSCLPSDLNNAVREVMSHLKAFSDGTDAIDALAVDNLKLDGNTISSTDTNGDITLDPNGTGDTIIASGNLGVGTTSPDHTLTVSASSSPTLEIEQTSGGPYKTNIVLNGNDTEFRGSSGNIEFYTGNDDGASSTERMRIDGSGTVTFTEGDAVTVIDRVGTNVAGIKTGSGDDFCVGTADYPQAIRIKNSNGAVGIGETAPDTAFDVYRAAGDVSQVQTGRTTNSNVGMIRFRDGDDNACGQITSNPSTNTTNYVTSSDYRLKENVVDMTGAITRVKTLSPKRFNFISNADVTVDGFLAHEAQAVVPEAVVGEHNEVDDDGNMVVQGIDLAKLVPLLTGALQEAIAKIETLETKVAALEAAD
jgi:hypothetical protein